MTLPDTLNEIASRCPADDRWCQECDRPKMSSSHSAHNLRGPQIPAGWQEAKP